MSLGVAGSSLLVPQVQAATALSVYPVNAAGSVTGTGGYATGSGGTGFNGLPVRTTAQATGWIEFWWSSGGGIVNTSGLTTSIGRPDDHGYLLDSTTLEGQQIPTGSWSGNQQLWLATGMSANLTERAYVRHGDGTFVAIGSIASATIVGSTSYRTVSLPATPLPAASFTLGDRLYVDFWLHVTSNTTTAQSLSYLQMASSGSLGSPADYLATPGYETAASRQSGLIPAYWVATDPAWSTLIDNPTDQPSTIIANNGSGPGGTLDPDLLADIEKARAAGYKVIGYDITSQGTRSLGAIEADVDTWYSRYPLDGIFLDDLPGYDAAHECFYRALSAYVKAKTGANVKGTTVVLNGASIPSDPKYVDFSDTLTTFEGTEASLLGGAPFHAPWMDRYVPSHFAVILYGGTDPSAVADLSEANHVGLFYDTDRTSYGATVTNWQSAQVPALDR
jgi:hypothetical protein